MCMYRHGPTMSVVAVLTAVTRTLSCAVAAAAPSSRAKSLPNCLSSRPSAGGVGVATSMTVVAASERSRPMRRSRPCTRSACPVDTQARPEIRASQRERDVVAAHRPRR